MKTLMKLCFFLLLASAFFACSDKTEETYIVNEPVYLSYEDLRGSLKVEEGQEIIQPGKIYLKGQYIFVNEYQKGIHVIDNRDPSSPQIIKFIEIPGNVDMAIQENILYADSYVDLVAIDISDMNHITEAKRILNAFQYIVPVCDDGVVDGVNPDSGVVVGWRATERTVEDVSGEMSYPFFRTWNSTLVTMAEFDGGSLGNQSSGTGGSMARFTICDNYLYTVDTWMMRIFNINEAADPIKENELYVGWNIETIFPYDHKLFLGSTTGMHIYSLENPVIPTFVSMFWHASSCDPVVVEGNYAYVTLRAGNLCGDNLSQLDVIDISNLTEPALLKEYPMDEPYGLGIDRGTLFVCDGASGLKIYDATDPLTIDGHMLAQYNDLHAWDVIPTGDVLIMIGNGGLTQYDYSDLEHITKLSFIPIENLQSE